MDIQKGDAPSTQVIQKPPKKKSRWDGTTLAQRREALSSATLASIEAAQRRAAQDPARLEWSAGIVRQGIAQGLIRPEVILPAASDA